MEGIKLVGFPTSFRSLGLPLVSSRFHCRVFNPRNNDQYFAIFPN